jgi:hypothetical protein
MRMLGWLGLLGEEADCFLPEVMVRAATVRRAMVPAAMRPLRGRRRKCQVAAARMAAMGRILKRMRKTTGSAAVGMSRMALKDHCCMAASLRK